MDWETVGECVPCKQPVGPPVLHPVLLIIACLNQPSVVTIRRKLKVRTLNSFLE